jgi:hypothetical protein
MHKNIIKDREHKIKFNNQQKKAIKYVCNFINNEDNLFGLYGYAGTGKTTTIIETVTGLIKTGIIKKVVFTAPTNQAVIVLKNKFKNNIEEIYEKYYKLNFANSTFEDKIDALKLVGIEIVFITIHKLLKFELDMDNKGNVIFVRNGNKSIIDKYDFVVIDECSMLQINIIDELIHELKTNIKLKKSKILFSGDPAQLPPVNEKTSCIFNMNITKKYYTKIIKFNDNINVNSNNDMNTNINDRYDNFENVINNMKSFTLKKVMRTKNKNIINMCYTIRLWIINNDELNLQQYSDKNDIYFYLNDCVNKMESKWFKKFIDNYTKNDNNNSNIILTWTNKQTDTYNSSIRKILFNKIKLNRFEINDILLVNEYYEAEAEMTSVNINNTEFTDKKKLYTSEQLKILNIENIYKNTSKFIKITLNDELKNYKELNKKYNMVVDRINHILTNYYCYKLKVMTLNRDNCNIITIYVIHETQLDKYNSDKNNIYDILINFNEYIKNNFIKDNENNEEIEYIEKNIIKSLWKFWHKIFVEPYANVTYGYSVTCHKAQGTNFDNVFVDINDIEKNTNKSEMKKCIYTAITRTTNEIHLLT